MFYLNDKWDGINKESYQTQSEHKILSKSLTASLSLRRRDTIVKQGLGIYVIQLQPKAGGTEAGSSDGSKD
ncbi:hypothetical protein DL770_008826 [Monosporascus sp. CRB-9-2]|nr:hypothetical protein DL770_008826 [Monosporascus sp. CRB-9-2]